MEDISSTIFILQNHHCVRSPSRTVNVNPTDTCQIGDDYMQAYGIDKYHTLKIKNIQSPEVTGNNHDQHKLHILLAIIYTPIGYEKSKKIFFIYHSLRYIIP